MQAAAVWEESEVEEAEGAWGVRYCVCLSVRGALGWSKKELMHARSWITHDDGRPTTVQDVREWLMDELAKGHEVYPFGKCDNFDWKTGCKGHPDERSVG